MNISTTNYDSIANKFVSSVEDMPGNRLYERPATLSLLPDLAGLDVLDAGCGHGFYSEVAVNAGARVVAFDPSAEMIKHAKARLGENCEIHHCLSSDLNSVLNGRRFDLVLSNLVLHYVSDLNIEFTYLAQTLKPDGMLLISMKHPLIHMGYIRKFGYRKTGKVQIDWKWAGGKVVHVQRPLHEITEAIHSAGLIIERLVEATPLKEMARESPDEYKMAMSYPFFLHLVLRPRVLPVKQPYQTGGG